MSKPDELAIQILQTFISKMDAFENTVTKLANSIEHLQMNQRDTVSELRELRREFAALAAKLEMAMGRR